MIPNFRAARLGPDLSPKKRSGDATDGGPPPRIDDMMDLPPDTAEQVMLTLGSHPWSPGPE
jgi:hypothetical protein